MGIAGKICYTSGQVPEISAVIFLEDWAAVLVSVPAFDWQNAAVQINNTAIGQLHFDLM
jgi:hypothetical protein